MTDEMVSYYVSCSDGDFVMELPTKYKITFAAVNPAGGDSPGYSDKRLHCLRVWDGPGKTAALKAVFCNVRGVRDLSIPLARKVTKETGSAAWTKDSAGNFSEETRREIESAYVPDSVDDIPF